MAASPGSAPISSTPFPTRSDGPPGGGSFFGRRRGKTLRAGQEEALAAHLPALRIDLGTAPPQPLQALFAAPVAAVHLEIGFGGGEHLLHRAASEPNTGFIGVEPFRNGLAKAVAAIAAADLRNVRLHDDEAAPLLDWLPPDSLAGIDLLYPDPWPKRRHRKRRFVNPVNLERIARVLAPGGIFRFASDIDDYVEWTLRAVAAHGALLVGSTAAAERRRPPPGWPGTRYERKALGEGRQPTYLTFMKPA